ncbi:MAG: hypothetical protein E7395_02775 [Ruminococcaceae bacterium]|nr:hypothetical protein [Oscillospiraceae bacterium]
MKRIIAVFLIFIMLISFSANHNAVASEDSIKSHMLSNYSKAISLSGKNNFVGYCAACVSYQLMAYGIIDKYVYGNGNSAYQNYSSIITTPTGWHTKSYPASEISLSQILEKQNASPNGFRYYPIVLGFNKGTASSAGQAYGHTMMIYAVRGGKVYFTDSLMPNTPDNIYSLSISEFCNRYSDNPTTLEKEFVYDGAVVFYNSLPDTIDISVSNTQNAPWAPVTFKFSSPATVTYSLAVYKNNVRIQTIHTNSNTYTSSYGEPGSYTAYVSASNLLGSVDSYTISFNVQSAPANAYMYASKQWASVGESVTFEYGAENATSYSVGIYYPDGSFEAVHTSGTGKLTRAFNMPGTYILFASCCSVGGHIDTNRVSVEIY